MALNCNAKCKIKAENSIYNVGKANAKKMTGINVNSFSTIPITSICFLQMI